MGGCVADGACHAVVVPIEQVARSAGALVERIGVLDEGGIFRILREMLHGASFAEAGWSMQEGGAKVVAMTTAYRTSLIGIAGLFDGRVPVCDGGLVVGLWRGAGSVEPSRGIGFGSGV